jgi:hypothetical protein
MSKMFDCTPFYNITDFIKAVLIVEKLFCNTKKNHHEVNKCINALVENINDNELVNFIIMITSYPKIYPYEIITNIEQFIQQIDIFSLQHNGTSLTLQSPATKCIYGNFDNKFWYEFVHPKFLKDPILYGHSKIEKIMLNVKRCKKCLRFHYLSYAIDTDFMPHSKRFFSDFLTAKYFHYSNETIFETKLIKQYLADLLFKHCSFKAFSESYNFLHANIEQNRFSLDPKRLADVFYAYELCKFYHENNLNEFCQSIII